MDEMRRSGFTSVRATASAHTSTATWRAPGHNVTTSPEDGLRHHNGKADDLGSAEVVMPAARLPAPGWATGGSNSPCAGG